MKNIRSVLENKETEAWQKLIRVLTHEIMNSMTPIVSLSELLRNKCMDEPGVDTEDREEINQAVETIFRRSSGLVRFVESYRKVTGIPMPIPEIIPVNHFLDNISLLFKDQKDKIKIVPATAHLQVIADKGLIEQVLINLVKNALDATRHCLRPQIELSAGINEEGKTFIRVSDRHRVEYFQADHAHAQRRFVRFIRERTRQSVLRYFRLDSKVSKTFLSREK